MKILYEKLLVIFLLVVFSKILLPQEFKKTATAGFTFLEIPVTARYAGLGESSVALSDLNSDGIFINPASIGFTNQTHSFSSSYANWFADIKHYAMSYSYNSSFGVFAAGVIIMDFGSMPRTVAGGGQKVYNIIGSFNANSIAAALGYSKMLTDRFSFGIVAKYVEEKIDIYKASNILLDGGVLYFTGLGSLRIAASLQNFGTNTKFINDEFKMPIVFKLGAAAELIGSKESDYRVTLITEASHPTDANERLNFGAEISWNEMVTFRGGYKFFYDEETYSLGFGVNPKLDFPMNLDFAFADYGRLGKILRLSLQLGLY
ncbi:MAG: PorV/PorQ family protein [Ignavibacterium sp.]|nr:PorV/PorQ family protein [Ignavibacterium sp.]